MNLSRSSGSSRCLVSALLIGVFAFLVSQNGSKGDEVPAFFLKIAKNIPRVGRSDGYGNLMKSHSSMSNVGGRNNDGQSESWSSYANDEPFQGPIKRRMSYPAVEESHSWQQFPLAIEGPQQLWRTLAGYSRDNSDDIDNEVWKRKKRTGSEVASSEDN
ncbi:ecdysis triggering hormone [Calliopsis andreniformis]|uniref:ecdysis triggering hormone n=1 Tax=Calliopsis andreniformis TaxID=337506 RepID=UPI003FCEDD74